MSVESRRIKKQIHRKSLPAPHVKEEQQRRLEASQRLERQSKLRSFSQVYHKYYPHHSDPSAPVIRKEPLMDEIYAIIEEKIKESGYAREISGYQVYSEISDFIEDKDNGRYIFMSKPFDDVVFEYGVDVMDEDFNLSYLDINASEGKFHIDFDN